MQNVPAQVWAITRIVAVAIVLVCTMYFIGDIISNRWVMTTTDAFQQQVRQCGYVDGRMIRDFNQTLAGSHKAVKITMVHDSLQYYPTDEKDEDGDTFKKMYFSVDQKTICDTTDQGKKYKMKIGDNFYVYVDDMGDNFRGLIARILGLDPSKCHHTYPSGGMIQNEIL